VALKQRDRCLYLHRRLCLYIVRLNIKTIAFSGKSVVVSLKRLPAVYSNTHAKPICL